MEKYPLEHERDLTNSAAERVIFPESFLLTDYLLRQLQAVLRGLTVDEKRIRLNLDLTGGLIMSERVMLGLTARGFGARRRTRSCGRLPAPLSFPAGRCGKFCAKMNG